jgi:L-asparagine oxygenase
MRVNTCEVAISEGDRNWLVERASRCVPDPYREFEEFLRDAAAAFRSLSDQVRDSLREFVTGAMSCGALLIKGLPEDPTLPPTPVHDDGSRYTSSTITEFTMCAIASAVGEPVGYAPERWGQLVHNVFPSQAENIPSRRFRTGLGFHSELSCHPESPGHVLLLCLRQDPDRVATTWVLEVRTLLASLPEAVTADLFRPEFALDLGKLHYVYRSGGERISNRPEHRPVIGILAGDRSDPSVRYEPALMTPLTGRAKRAFDYLAGAVSDLATPVVLTPGSALLIDNRRSLHARSTFPAYFDGRDRWLRRMMIADGPRPRSAKGTERVIDSDILVGWSHRPTVASLGGVH